MRSILAWPDLHFYRRALGGSMETGLQIAVRELEVSQKFLGQQYSCASWRLIHKVICHPKVVIEPGYFDHNTSLDSAQKSMAHSHDLFHC